jgi:maltooligosyltrehalose trehalohydrolase
VAKSGPLTAAAPPRRRLAIGAEPVPGGVHFRVWAPSRRTVDVVVDGAAPLPLDREADGHFSALAPGVAAGARYVFRLDGDVLRPDPASRFQPEGPNGPSEVVDPGAFRWSDGAWRGLGLAGQVISELHVGTFTPEGTWASAARELPRLVDVGITCVELLPVADFAGAFGWGYDGVDPFAPTRLYGRPDDMRAFVDRAHALGLGVILDVVYNHLGPDGAPHLDFSETYLTDRYPGEWGTPLNYDGEGSQGVRELVVENAGFWISEHHLDGLRLDATQAIFDASEDHVLAALARRARAAAGPRRILLVAENEPQDARLVRAPADGGYGLDALWNDDFHHSATVALTGRAEAYYSDHRGTPQELVSAAKHGYLFQGQRYAWQGQPRGTSTRGVPPAAFVCYLENHDQIANSAHGARVPSLTTAGRWRAMTALLLLGPWTPMLFQGQELGSTRPFLFFADHAPELAERVRAGRARFLHQFPSIARADDGDLLADPGARATFEACKLDPAERAAHPEILALHRELLALRRTDAVLRAQGAGGVDGAVLGPEAFALRWLDPGGADRLLLVNLGADLVRRSLAEPLVAPPARAGWLVAWSSEDPRYGGSGAPPPFGEEGVHLAGHAATLLAPAGADRG